VLLSDAHSSSMQEGGWLGGTGFGRELRGCSAEGPLREGPQAPSASEEKRRHLHCAPSRSSSSSSAAALIAGGEGKKAGPSHHFMARCLLDMTMKEMLAWSLHLTRGYTGWKPSTSHTAVRKLHVNVFLEALV